VPVSLPSVRYIEVGVRLSGAKRTRRPIQSVSVRFRLIAAALLLSCIAAKSQPPGAACLPCHAKQVTGYAKTAMAHSISRASALAVGSYVHESSGTKFAIENSETGPRIAIQNGNLSATWKVAYVIGSGSHAYGLLVGVRDYLFQAPVSYYAHPARWGAAPGFESAPALDFGRPVTPECLYCHADIPRPIDGTLNRYQNPPLSGDAISCDRCHGDAAAHLRHPARDNIVNPAALSERARDSVCEQCHLSGEARVLNPGREWGDFKPGKGLEQIYSVYVRADADRAPLKVISHAEQLAMSRCARESGGNLWCGTCHNAHEQPTEPATYYRARCLTCHAQSLPAAHPKLENDSNCIGCHMPSRQTSDGAHTVFTDHRIARVPARPMESSAVTKLRAWREPSSELRLRNLGLANIEAGVRRQSDALIGEGANQIQEALKMNPRDLEMLTQLGVVLIRARETADAIKLLEAAITLSPEDALAHVNLGDAYREARMYPKAIVELNRAIELDPSLQDAYRSLELTHLLVGNREAARQTLERYLTFIPQSITARMALAEAVKK